MNTSSRLVSRAPRLAFVAVLAIVAAGGYDGVAPRSALAKTGATVATDSAVTSAARLDYVAQARARFTPESRTYWFIRSVASFTAPLYDGAIMLLLLFGGISAAMRDLAHAFGRNRYMRTLIYVALFASVVALLSLPVAWFLGFWLEHRFGLSNQTFVAWLGDQGKDLAVNVLFIGGTGLLALAYRAISRSPRRWWIRLGLGTMPVILFSTLIQPVFVDPLYNKFQPLQNKALEAKILDLAAKAEIPARKVFQVDKSRQTKTYNAYVTGFGASQRIVLWDTTIKGMKEDELLFVMGHEMGHYKLAHIWKGVALFSLLSFALFYFSWVSTRWAVRRFGARWRFHELHDLASLPLLAITLGIALQVADPISNGVSRAIEHEADMFGLEVTHSNDAAARAFLKLSDQNRSNPEPPALVKFIRYSHPPTVERIRFALDYRPWARGEPNRFFKPRR